MSQSPFNSPFDIDVEYFSSRFEIKGGRTLMLLRWLFRAHPLGRRACHKRRFFFSKGGVRGFV